MSWDLVRSEDLGGERGEIFGIRDCFEVERSR